MDTDSAESSASGVSLDQLLTMEIQSRHTTALDLFRAESSDEYSKIYCEKDGIVRGEHVTYDELADGLVKHRWIERGIWRQDWLGTRPEGPWLHELHIYLESESETDSEYEYDPCVDGIRPHPPPGRRPKCAAELQKVMERRKIYFEQREATRPISQFLQQVEEEKMSFADQNSGRDSLTDLEARNIVRERWQEYRIWSSTWEELPGMSWRHEEPFHLPASEKASRKVRLKTSTAQQKEFCTVSPHLSPVSALFSGASVPSHMEALGLTHLARGPDIRPPYYGRLARMYRPNLFEIEAEAARKAKQAEDGPTSPSAEKPSHVPLPGRQMTMTIGTARIENATRQRDSLQQFMKREDRHESRRQLLRSIRNA